MVKAPKRPSREFLEAIDDLAGKVDMTRVRALIAAGEIDGAIEIVHAKAGGTLTTRRAMQAGLALALTPAKSDGATDPIFAAIARMNESDAAHCASCEAADSVAQRQVGKTVTPEAVAEKERLADAYAEAEAEFASTAPTTRAGIVAALEHAREYSTNGAMFGCDQELIGTFLANMAEAAGSIG